MSEPKSNEEQKLKEEKPKEEDQPKNLSIVVDPFDPMNLGITTDYAAAINAIASTKPFDLRRPNDQEFFRTSPDPSQHIFVGSITDKQDMSRVYIISHKVRDEVKAKHPKAIRGVDLILTQTLAKAPLLWPVPLAEDRGGKWNSSQRAACDQGKSRWTNMISGRGQYDCTTVDNPTAVDWTAFPPFNEVLRQGLAERFVDSMDHPLLRKLRGETE